MVNLRTSWEEKGMEIGLERSQVRSRKIALEARLGASSAKLYEPLESAPPDRIEPLLPLATAAVWLDELAAQLAGRP